MQQAILAAESELVEEAKNTERNSFFGALFVNQILI